MATAPLDAKINSSGKDGLYHALALRQGQTRLLRLKADAGQSQLEGELVVVNILDQARAALQTTGKEVTFKALSYTWGTSPHCDSIKINGHRKDIKENLADFLYQYRAKTSADERAYIWIDALCINQDDSVEKSSQVAVMRTFYSAADEVIVWLGKEGRHTAKAVEYFHKIEAEATKGSSVLSMEDVEALHDHGTLYGLVDVYSRPWSTRIWIKQEAWAARYVTIWCGNHRWHPYAWASFGAALFLAGEDDYMARRLKLLGLDTGATTALLGLEWGPPMEQPPDSESDGRRAGGHEAPKRDILDLIKGSAWSQCSDERDRIYALLGMSTIQQSDLTLDYQKATEQVYVDLAIHVATSRRSIGALLGLNASFGAREGLELPSWVPDWRSLTDDPIMARVVEQATLVDDDSERQTVFKSKRPILTGYNITVLRQYSSTFLTTSGIVPQADDLIVACFGCGLPVVLRRFSPGASPLGMHYRFIGLLADWSCLFHPPGLVHELRRWWSSKSIDAQSFFEESRGQKIFSFHCDFLEDEWRLSFSKKLNEHKLSLEQPTRHIPSEVADENHMVCKYNI